MQGERQICGVRRAASGTIMAQVQNRRGVPIGVERSSNAASVSEPATVEEVWSAASRPSCSRPIVASAIAVVSISLDSARACGECRQNRCARLPLEFVEYAGFMTQPHFTRRANHRAGSVARHRDLGEIGGEARRRRKARQGATFAYTSTAFPMPSGKQVTVAGFVPIGMKAVQLANIPSLVCSDCVVAVDFMGVAVLFTPCWA